MRQLHGYFTCSASETGATGWTTLKLCATEGGGTSALANAMRNETDYMV
jgi:hypothetical protein